MGNTRVNTRRVLRVYLSLSTSPPITYEDDTGPLERGPRGYRFRT